MAVVDMADAGMSGRAERQASQREAQFWDLLKQINLAQEEAREREERERQRRKSQQQSRAETAVPHEEDDALLERGAQLACWSCPAVDGDAWGTGSCLPYLCSLPTSLLVLSRFPLAMLVLRALVEAGRLPDLGDVAEGGARQGSLSPCARSPWHGAAAV